MNSITYKTWKSSFRTKSGWRIFKYFWKICLLKSGPDRIPAEPLILGLVLTLSIIAEVVGASLARPSQSIVSILGTVLIEVTIIGLVTFLLLLFTNMLQRFIPTYTSLLGAGIFMMVIQVPFFLIMRNTDSSTLAIFSESVLLVCLGWWLAIVGNIYHRVANISILQGSAIGLVILILIATAIFVVSPSPQQIQQIVGPSAL